MAVWCLSKLSPSHLSLSAPPPPPPLAHLELPASIRSVWCVHFLSPHFFLLEERLYFWWNFLCILEFCGCGLWLLSIWVFLTCIWDMRIWVFSFLSPHFFFLEERLYFFDEILGFCGCGFWLLSIWVFLICIWDMKIWVLFLFEEFKFLCGVLIDFFSC